VAAGGVSSLPLTGAVETTGFAIDGRPRPLPGRGPSADYNVASPGYFKAMGMPMVAGRTFDSRDRAGAVSVLVVNEEFARRHWPGESALGKRIYTGFLGADVPHEIVGVVRDSRQLTLDTPVAPAMYFPATQLPYPFLTFVVRTASEDPAVVLPLMRRELKAMDPAIALNDVRSLRSVVDASLARQRFGMIVIGVFAAAALALAMVGLYGVIAYSVAQRTREIGIRMALGAQRTQMLSLVLRQSLTLVVLGLIVGFAAALAATRLMRTLLYGVGANDFATYAVVVVVLGGAALLASYIPARRAMKVDPMIALRYE
jgi:putative ABC transport system permease protein